MISISRESERDTRRTGIDTDYFSVWEKRGNTRGEIAGSAAYVEDLDVGGTGESEFFEEILSGFILGVVDEGVAFC